MKIAYLTTSAHLGGAELSLLDLMASLRSTVPDWQLSIISPGEGLLMERANAMGVRAISLPFPERLARLGDSPAGRGAGKKPGTAALAARLLLAGPDVASYALKLRGLLRDVQPDIVHTNGFKVHIIGVRVAPARVPVVWHLRDYIGARPATRRLMQSHARKCAAAIANSQSVADDARAVWGETPRTHVVLNRIDLEWFSPAGPTLDLDALAGLPRASDGVVRVGLPATFARWKGHEMFLDAFERIPASVNLRGYIIGGPLYETEGSQHTSEELRALVQRHGLDQRVGLTGYVDDSAAAMRALDIVVHASTHPEPFGRTIVEAMGCGRSVVTSAIGGARELIEDGVDALSFEPGSAADLARVIDRLARDPTLRDQLSHRARATAIRRFDRREIAAEIIPIYQSVKPLQKP